MKQLPGALSGTRKEVAEYFKDFVEDYNTATMPHAKFYDYEKWEVAEHKRLREAAARGEGGSINPLADEEAMRHEAMARKRAAEERLLQATKANLQNTAGLREAMGRQDKLMTEMAAAHKRGDVARVKKIQDKLAPDEWKGTVYGR